MQILLLATLFLLNISCATTYHIEVAPTFEQSSDFIFAGLDGMGDPYYAELKSDGLGWSIGLIETTDYLFAKFTYSEVKMNHKEVIDPVNGNSKIDLSDNYSSFDVALGLNLAAGYLKPYVSSTTRMIDNGIDSDSFSGAGVRIEIPVGKSTKIALDYNQKKLVPENELYTGPDDEITTFYIGLMFGGWQIGGNNNGNK